MLGLRVSSPHSQLEKVFTCWKLVYQLKILDSFTVKNLLIAILRAYLDTTEFRTTVILTLCEKEGTTLSQKRHFLTPKKWHFKGFRDRLDPLF